MSTTTFAWRSAAVLAASLLPLAAAAGTKQTSSWAAPDLKPTAYAKVVVLAKFTDESAVRILEDAMVKGLKDRGIEAVQAYQVLTPADLASDAAVEAKANELGADAGLVFAVTADTTQTQSSNASVSVGVGVPVRAGPFSLFVGTNVPLGGGTSTVRSVSIKCELVAKGGNGPRWIGTYTTDVKAGTEGTANELAKLVLKQLKKSGVFPKK